MKQRKRSGRTFFIISGFVAVFCIISNCGQSTLEPNGCRDSRDIVKKFYSFHIGNEMKPSRETLARRVSYLSKNLAKALSGIEKTNHDYFTQTDDYPLASRVSECKPIEKDRVAFVVLLFGRTGAKNIQREIEVEVVKESSKWLIDKVIRKGRQK